MTSEKSYLTEQRLNQLITDGWAGPYFVAKTADLGRSSTTISDDPDLSLTVPNGGDYLVFCGISYKGGTGTAEGDLKFGWSVTSGQFVIAAGKRRTADGTYDFQRMTNGDTAPAQTIGLANDLVLTAQGHWVPTASGTITFRWCKNTAADGSTNTTVEQYSYLALIRGQ